MSYIVTKTIKGHEYLYEYEGKRVNGKPKMFFVRYLGAVSPKYGVSASTQKLGRTKPKLSTQKLGRTKPKLSTQKLGRTSAPKSRLGGTTNRGWLSRITRFIRGGKN